MSQNDWAGTAAEPEDWASWLIRVRRARGKRPIDLVEAAKALGKKLSTSQITNWEKRRNPASPEAARLVAEILEIDPVVALRAAGHEDWAEYTEAQRGPAPVQPRDEVLEFLAELRASPDPEKHKIADRLEQDLERAGRFARMELNELERQHAAEKSDDADVNTSVNKSA